VEVRFRGRLDRHDPKLPRFVVLPASAAAALGLQHRVTVEGTLGRVPFGRRSIKPWGDGRYFIDVPGDLCRKAAVDVGDTVDVSVTVVDDRPPADLVDALGRDTVAARAWARLTPSQQRRIVDDVVQAVRPTTRQRRIARWVGQLSRP
jgi:Bacteriocin-protection, YdeI or OmpD-Associated/Domain of unknown function (DUF1905)